MMIEKHIAVGKTARYFVSGKLSGNLRQLWFVCHGYGGLASRFLDNFKVLDEDEHMVVAPEGLHRFYLEGTTGETGASWMTREGRLADIEDNIHYLNRVYDEVMNDMKGQKIKVSVLGFSQGAATVCRWLCNGKSGADNLILWGGLFPPDLNLEAAKTVFGKMNIWQVTGDKDEFVGKMDLEKQQAELAEKGILVKPVWFQGTHEIKPEVLESLAQEL